MKDHSWHDWMHVTGMTLNGVSEAGSSQSSGFTFSSTLDCYSWMVPYGWWVLWVSHSLLSPLFNKYSTVRSLTACLVSPIAWPFLGQCLLLTPDREVNDTTTKLVQFGKGDWVAVSLKSSPSMGDDSQTLQQHSRVRTHMQLHYWRASLPPGIVYLQTPEMPFYLFIKFVFICFYPSCNPFPCVLSVLPSLPPSPQPMLLP